MLWGPKPWLGRLALVSVLDTVVETSISAAPQKHVVLLATLLHSFVGSYFEGFTSICSKSKNIFPHSFWGARDNHLPASKLAFAHFSESCRRCQWCGQGSCQTFSPKASADEVAMEDGGIHSRLFCYWELVTALNHQRTTMCHHA